MFLVLSIIIIIILIERAFIIYIRTPFVNRQQNRLNRFIYIYFRNNIVDIDTETETCTEVDNNEYKHNFQDSIIYANGVVDIETGIRQQLEINDEEFKDFNNVEIRQPNAT
jgi:hypothetical protein